MRRKDFTSFDLAAVTSELKPVISDSRVNNIYQLDEKTLIFKLHKANLPPIRLVMEAGRRLHTTVYAQESPAAPPVFCMSLRKYLRGAWVVNIDQYEFERIVTVTFRAKEGVLKLVVELFGEGNFILVNEKNMIWQALFLKRMRDRNILRNEVLVVPPPSGKNPFKVSLPEMAEALKNAGETEVVRAMARMLGIGGVYAEEVLLRVNVDKAKPCRNLTDEEVKGIFDALQGLLSKISAATLEPSIILDQDEQFLDVVPLKLKRYEGFKPRDFSTFNQALDEFYLRVTTAENAFSSVEADKLKLEAERLKRVVGEQEKSIHEDEAKAERDKLIGDTIYAHFNELQMFQDKLLNANRAGKDWDTVMRRSLAAKKAGNVPEVYIQSFDGRNLALNLCLDNFQFSFSIRNSLFENANEYYERGKKAKQKSQGALSALEDSKRKLTKIERELSAAEEMKSLKPAALMEALAKRKVETENRQWYEKFRWFTSSDGFLVAAGKDTVSNEVLVKKYHYKKTLFFTLRFQAPPSWLLKLKEEP